MTSFVNCSLYNLRTLASSHGSCLRITVLWRLRPEHSWDSLASQPCQANKLQARGETLPQKRRWKVTEEGALLGGMALLE